MNATTSVETTITVTSTGGFSGKAGIQQRTSNPTNLTATLSVNSVTISSDTPGNSVLTIASPSDHIDSGDYLVNVTATSGIITHFIVIHVRVADFGITAPSMVTMYQGTLGGVGLIFSDLPVTYSFFGLVNITYILPLGSGMTASCSPSQVNFTRNEPVNPYPTCKFTASKAGTFRVTFTGTATITGTTRPLSHSVVVTVIVKGPDFSIESYPNVFLEVLPSSLTSNSTTMQITQRVGFNGTVALSVSSNPVGPNFILAKTVMVNTTYPVVETQLTILTPATVSPGNYLVTVTGTSGGLTHNATILLDVVSFTLTAAPNQLIVNQGTSQSSKISVVPLNGFSSTVILSASTPTGLMATLADTFIAGPGSTTLHLSASQSLKPGTYLVNITAIVGTFTQSTSLTVTVQASSFKITPSTAITIQCIEGISCNTYVTVEPPNGFSGSITFTVSPSTPPGLSCVTPLPLATTGNETLSCMSASPGDFTVTVTGSSGGLTQTSASITYHVMPPPDFSISAGTTAPSTILAGGSGTSTISVSFVGGFGGVVTLTPSISFPSGLTCQPLTSMTSTGTTPLTCGGAVAGDYVVVVYGDAAIGGSLIRRVTYSILFHIVDFTIAASPTTLNTESDKVGTSTVTLTAVNQFNGVVNLSTDNHACSVNPESTTGSGTASLSCAFVSAGSITVTVTGTIGNLHHSTQFNVTVTPAAVRPASTVPTILGLSLTLFYGLIAGIVAIVAVTGAAVALRNRNHRYSPKQ
jgi:hypothetical protein